MTEKVWLKKEKEHHSDTGSVEVGTYIKDGITKLPRRMFPKCMACNEPFSPDDEVLEVRKSYVLDSVGHHYPKDGMEGYIHRDCRDELARKYNGKDVPDVVRKLDRLIRKEGGD